MLRIGLDIDDVLADFIGRYYQYFDCVNHPERMQDHIITRNVQRILRQDRDFWVNLPVINRPDFEPVLYCTKRVNPKVWTKTWLRLNGLPDRPVYQLFNQGSNKANMIKGRVDVFIDDSVRNVEQLNASGVPALLFRRHLTGFKSIYSLELDEITKAYKSIQRWKLK